MSTPAQIAANQKNALASTGPVTEIGLKRSSQNSTLHGFTGKTLVLTPEERAAYEAHVAAYMADHNPTEHKHIELVQQLADLHWSLHQIFVQQTNTMSLMNAITVQMLETGDPLAIAAAIAPVARTLNNLSVYEGRRRRAAKSVQEELTAYEQALKSQKTKPQTEIGSVCSAPATAEEVQTYNDDIEAFFREVEGELGPEEAAKVRRELGY
jgi:hypothetical protein